MIPCARVVLQAAEAEGRTFGEVDGDGYQVWLDVTMAEAISVAVLDVLEKDSLFRRCETVRREPAGTTLQVATHDPEMYLRVFVCEGSVLTGDGS